MALLDMRVLASQNGFARAGSPAGWRIRAGPALGNRGQTGNVLRIYFIAFGWRWAEDGHNKPVQRSVCLRFPPGFPSAKQGSAESRGSETLRLFPSRDSTFRPLDAPKVY